MNPPSQIKTLQQPPQPPLRPALPPLLAALPLPASAAALPLAALALVLAAAPALRAADIYWGGGTGAITDDNWFSDATRNTRATRANTDALNLPSGTLTIATAATVAETGIGTAPGDRAAIIVTGTWTNTGGELSIGGSAASSPGAGNVAGAGALTILAGGTARANTFYIGNYGSGTLHLAQGAQLTNTANAFLGRNTGGSGTATIDGRWHMDNGSGGSGYLIVGNAADSHGNLLIVGPTGTLTLKNNYFAIANNPDTSGTAIIQGSITGYSYLRVAAKNTAPGNSTGELIISGYAADNGTAAAITSIGWRGSETAGTPPSVGVLRITETGTLIVSSSETTLGHYGLGSGAAYISNASGTALVDGVWKNAGHLIVGRSGHGHLEIGAGGTVTVGAYLAIALYNSGSNAAGRATGPVGGTVIVNGHLAISDYLNIGAGTHTTASLTIGESGHLAIGAHALIGAGDRVTATLRIGPNGTLRTGANGTGDGYLQVGRNGSTAGSGTAAPVTGASILQVDGLLDIGGDFNFGMRSKTELTLGAEGNILVTGHHYQSANTLLAFTPAPGATRDLPLVATAKTAILSGTLKLTNLDNLAGYTTAATATAATALPSLTIINAAAGITGDFKTITITPALTGTAGLPDYIYNGKTILPTAPAPAAANNNAPAEYRIGQLLAWHAPAANAHGAFTIPAGNTFTLDLPLADRADAPAIALATGWDGKSLAKRGPGTLVLAAPATRTGDTTIESGTLRLATNDTTTPLGNLVNHATLESLPPATPATPYRTLTATTLAGTGTLILAAAAPAADAPGDRLIITGNAAGTHTLLVSINNAAPTPATPGQLATLITITGSNTATFNTPSAPPPGITVTLAPQGGALAPDAPAQITLAPGATYGSALPNGALPTPARPDATFAGWFTAPTAGTQVTPATTLAPAATHHILYARWIEGRHPIINPATDIAPGNDLYGSIIDDTGAPVPNVVVSDGFQNVKTDARGIYQMKRTNKTNNIKARLVYYSTPETHAINTTAGTAPAQARFHTKLTPDLNRYNFDLVRLPAKQTDFILLGVGDPQPTSLAHVARYQNETMADIARFRQTTPLPIYAILLGDIVGDNLHLHGPVRDATNTSGLTWFSVIGNHDHDQAYSNLNKDYESGETYENTYGPLNYSLNIGDLHIIGLDDVLYTKQSGYGTGLTDDILEWIRQDLSFVPKTKTIVLAYHIPLRGRTDYKNASALYALLKDYAGVHLFAGHTHYQQNITFKIPGSTAAKDITAYEHIHGGACGAWWNSIINTDGAPNAYGIYTISGTQFTDWYSKPTGYSDTYQMRMYRGDTPFGSGTVTYTYGKTANDIVIDIFNSDTTGKWKYAVYENDTLVSNTLAKLAAMTDAYAAGQHVGILGRAGLRNTGTRGNYDSANNNNHLYHHTLRTSGAATRVEIQATDPFGKTYTVNEFTTNLAEFPATYTKEKTTNYASPAITTHPQNTTITTGQTATLTAAATGTPAPTYKWQTLAPGATHWTTAPAATTTTTHTIPAATPAHNNTRYRLLATNLRGTAPTAPATLTVNTDPAHHAAQTLKTQLETPGAATITITGTIDLTLVAGATIATGKTLAGADAASTITGPLTLAPGADNTIIHGLNFTAGTLTINGANDLHLSHCTFTDTPITITAGADNITLAWNQFTATPATAGSAMTLSNAGAATGIILDHNHWAAGLRADMPAATNARVLMLNNLFTATGNTTATIAGAGAQILSTRNTYQGTRNPLAKQSTGLIRALDNHMTATTGTTAPGTDKIFVPAYAHITTPAANLAAAITTHAGNTAGKTSSHPEPTATAADITLTATVTGPGATKTATHATIPAGGGFTLTATLLSGPPPTPITPAARQWYCDNFPIPGATAATHTVTNADATHAGAYAVTLTTPAGELVTTPAYTVTITATSPGGGNNPGGNNPGGGSGSGSGGGGAPTLLLPALALLLTLARRPPKK